MPIDPTKARNLTPIVAIVAALMAAPAVQAHDWAYTGTVYLFASDTTTEIGPVETELSFADALENLDFAFMGAFEASNGTWSLITDYMRTDLSFSDGSPLAGFTGSEATVTTNILTDYVAYRVFTDGTTNIDVGAGIRWFETDAEIVLTGGSATPSQSLGDNWIDPLVMVRGQTCLGDRWVAGAILDYGGFSSDRDTVQLTVNVGYKISDRWTIRGGYRYLDVNRCELQLHTVGTAPWCIL